MRAANNYADSLICLERYEEAKALWRETIPVARRILGENHHLTLRMRSIYARGLRDADCATLDDLSEAVITFEDTERTARRVMGRAHPLTTAIERDLRKARAILRARETPPTSG